MDDSIASDGERYFTKKIEVEEKSEHQYKFRKESGEWILDESLPIGKWHEYIL